MQCKSFQSVLELSSVVVVKTIFFSGFNKMSNKLDFDANKVNLTGNLLDRIKNIQCGGNSERTVTCRNDTTKLGVRKILFF